MSDVTVGKILALRVGEVTASLLPWEGGTHVGDSNPMAKDLFGLRQVEDDDIALGRFVIFDVVVVVVDAVNDIAVDVSIIIVMYFGRRGDFFKLHATIHIQADNFTIDFFKLSVGCIWNFHRGICNIKN